MALPPISVRKELADGVVTLLNAQSFSIPCTASRYWRATETIEDTEVAKLTVTPGPWQKRITSRAGCYQYDATIVVLIEQETDASSTDLQQQDEIDVLAQEVEDVLCNPANRITIPENVSGTTVNRIATPTGATIEPSEERLAGSVFAVSVSVLYGILR